MEGQKPERGRSQGRGARHERSAAQRALILDGSPSGGYAGQNHLQKGALLYCVPIHDCKPHIPSPGPLHVRPDCHEIAQKRSTADSLSSKLLLKLTSCVFNRRTTMAIGAVPERPRPGPSCRELREEASATRWLGASLSKVRQTDYLIGREPVIRMSTSLLALCCQSGLDATLETPISARSKSNGSRSLRMSQLLMARFTSA
jgi:hypothetical protein